MRRSTSSSDPKPLREFTYDLFDAYRIVHPWAADDNIEPKSVGRDLFERSMSFGDYVAHYGIARSEGLLLRYLSDAYKGLVQTVPEDSKTEDLEDLTEWLGELVRQVDSSLLDEWERLRHPEELVVEAGPRPLEGGPPPLTANARAFRVMVRNECFRIVELAALRRWSDLAELDSQWSAARWEAAMAPFFEENDSVETGAAARSGSLFQVETGPGRWRVRQVFDDPDGAHEWGLLVEVDLAASDAEGAPVVRPMGIERL